MGFLGVLVAVATAGGVVALNPSASPWALGVGVVGGLIASYLTRSSGRWAVLIAILGLGALSAGIYGVRTGALPLPLALGFGLGGGMLLCMIAVMSGLFSLAIGDHKQTSFIAMILAAGLAYLPLMQTLKAASVPPIHDISTDTNSPPVFVAIAPLRKKANASNPTEYAGPETAAKQKQAYPDILPVTLDLPLDQAFAKALAAAKAMPDWEIVEANAEQSRIEATATSRFMGFKDDIVIRISIIGARSQIDIRSKSRVGRSDVGANAERIRAYVAKLKAG